MDSAKITPARFTEVSPNFFDIFKIPISTGRGFTPEEASGAADVAIVSKSMAQELWPNGAPIGAAIRIPPIAKTAITPRELQVIGVVPDIVSGVVGPVLGNRRLIYAPLNLSADDSEILLRVHGDQNVALRNIDRELSRIAPGAVYDAHNLHETFANQFFPFTVISAVALFVGILGYFS